MARPTRTKMWKGKGKETAMEGNEDISGTSIIGYRQRI
jgi:hypothetical protein